jgi:hypothetical protein
VRPTCGIASRRLHLTLPPPVFCRRGPSARRAQRPASWGALCFLLSKAVLIDEKFRALGCGPAGSGIFPLLGGSWRACGAAGDDAGPLPSSGRESTSEQQRYNSVYRSNAAAALPADRVGSASRAAPRNASMTGCASCSRGSSQFFWRRMQLQ